MKTTIPTGADSQNTKEELRQLSEISIVLGGTLPLGGGD
jgi:hypothetical protein